MLLQPQIETVSYESNPQHTYVAGIDFGGLHKGSYTGIAIFDRESKTLVRVMQKGGFASVQDELTWLCLKMHEFHVVECRFNESSPADQRQVLTQHGPYRWHDRANTLLWMHSDIPIVKGQPCVGNQWRDQVFDVLREINEGSIRVASSVCLLALSELTIEEKPTGLRLIYPEGLSALVFASILACLQGTTHHFSRHRSICGIM